MRILAWFGRRRRQLDLDEEDFQAEIRARLAIAAEERGGATSAQIRRSSAGRSTSTTTR